MPLSTAGATKPQAEPPDAGPQEKLVTPLPIAVEARIEGIDVRNCPRCGYAFAMAPKLAGKMIRCRSCRTLYRIAGGGQRPPAGVTAGSRTPPVAPRPKVDLPYASSSEPLGTIVGGMGAADAGWHAAVSAAANAGDVVPDAEGGRDVPVAFESTPGSIHDHAPSVLASVAAITLGGLMALPLTQLILWWGFDKDPLNMAAQLPDTLHWMAPDAVKKP